jgi:hypothetical protein
MHAALPTISERQPMLKLFVLVNAEAGLRPKKPRH